MRTKAGLITILFGAILVAGCQSTSFKKSKSGLVYKIFPSKDTAKASPGSIIKFYVNQKINDSVTFPPKGETDLLPQYARVEELGRPYDPSELYSQLKKGDSMVTVQMMDTFLKKSPGALPPQFKNGDRITTTFKVVEIFKNQEDVKKDQEKEQAKMTARLEKVKVQSMKDFDDYIAKNKINGTKTPGGVYVEVINPGQGMAIDSGKYVSVKYKGTTFTGEIFDTNMDESKGHSQPLEFIVGPHSPRPMIKGFDEGVQVLKNGGKGKFYIPSTLAYGEAVPPGGNIKPYENLIFEVEVLDVQEKAPGQQTPKAKLDTTQGKK